MDNIKTLLKLEYANYRSSATSKVKRNIVASVLKVVLSIILSYAVVYFIWVLGVEGDTYKYLSMIIAFVQIALLIYACSHIIKNIYYLSDKNQLAYLPISRWQIYLSKLIVCLCKTYSLAVVLMLPIVVWFGIIFKLSVAFYFISIIVIVIIPLLPMAGAILISIPSMYVLQNLRRFPIVNLLISVAITVIGFYLYSRVVFNIADIVILKNGKTNLVVQIANMFSLAYLPNTWASKFMLATSWFKNFALFFISSLLLFGGSVAIGACSYNYFFVKSLAQKSFIKRLKTTNKKRNAFWAFFVLELKETFRSINYSYTYFGMAVAMPYMVWICNSFIIKFAIENLGSQIIFGTSLFVVLVFVSIICSPSAAFISKEGDNIWILKTNPYGLKTPLYAKSLVGAMSCAISIFATTIVLIVLKHVSILQALAIMLIAFIFMTGVVSLGLFINILRPNIFKLNHQNNSNILLLILFSFIISLIVGIFSIVYCLFYPVYLVTLVSLAIVICFSIITVSLLLTNANRLAYKVEV